MMAQAESMKQRRSITKEPLNQIEKMGQIARRHHVFGRKKFSRKAFEGCSGPRKRNRLWSDNSKTLEADGEQAVEKRS
jgi:hypothetical protein